MLVDCCGIAPESYARLLFACDGSTAEEGSQCMQLQHGLLVSSTVDLGLLMPDSVRLWQAAADEERHTALFSHF
jgi:hypothetical protein